MAGVGATATVVLRLPASAAHVRTARLVAAAMARRSGVDEGLLDEVRLAVGEACARAVRLHERYGVDEPVTVEFGDVERFSVSVIDRAPINAAAPANATAPAGDPNDGEPRQPDGKEPVTVAIGPSGSGLVSGPGERVPAGAPEPLADADNLVPIRPAEPAIDLIASGGPVAGGADVAAGAIDQIPSGPGWLDATADALGLALLDAMVQDLEVTDSDAGAGTRVAMSWPLDR